jgi:hypothetical protein
VIRVESANARAVVTTADNVPGVSSATFQEFSAPLINAQGNILFAARWEGSKPGTGLFLWSPAGVQALELPAELKLAPKTLLEPIFFSHDEAAFVARGTPREAAIEQFFRAVANQSFQELKPPPDPAATVEVLAPRSGEKPVPMLLVLMEGGNVQTAVLPGDPAQPVVAKRQAETGPVKPLGRIEAQTTGSRGNIIFAATTADQPNDLGLYCFCDGQVIRETPPEEFLPIAQTAPGKPILSLVGDSRETVAFIAPNAAGEGTAIYVTSIP